MDANQESPSPQRRLLQREEVAALLQIPDPDLQWLIDTGQLTEIRIRGNLRFDIKELHQLVEAYKITQQRRDSPCPNSST